MSTEKKKPRDSGTPVGMSTKILASRTVSNKRDQDPLET